MVEKMGGGAEVEGRKVESRGSGGFTPARPRGNGAEKLRS